MRRRATAAAALVLGGALGLAACGSSDGGSEPATGSGEAAATYGTGACAPADGVDEPWLTFDDAPGPGIAVDKTSTAHLETPGGTVVLQLDTERTPITTNNFVNLARSGYFDGTDLFRTEAASGIIQGGSPHTQDNTDAGPGYDIPDEGMPFSSEDYAAGTIAMANAGPGTAGSQFFFLANDGGSYLGDPNAIGDSAGRYAVFGTVTEGLDVLQTIADLDDGSGAPSKPVTIESVTITES